MADVTTTFATASYNKIQEYINAGVITYPAYILCKDDAHKNNLIFIDKNLQMQPVKGYEQDSVIFVDELPTEGYRQNTFYVCSGTGYLYINDVPVPVFKDISESSITSYDQLTDLPIVNKYGEPTAPIVVADLEIGSYSISGNYKIGGNLETVYSTSRKVKFTIDADDTSKYITRFDADKIYVFTVNLESNEVVQDSYATEAWVKAQGYTTKDYVNQAIEDLYNRIANEALASITKVSQLENDAGYLTSDDINGIDYESIVGLF